MYFVIFITAPNRREANRIARELLKHKLAACVNIIGNVGSLFRWQGKIDSAKETLLIIKSRRALLNKLIKQVKSIHSYEVPEIIALPIIGGDKKYLKWISECTIYGTKCPP